MFKNKNSSPPLKDTVDSEAMQLEATLLEPLLIYPILYYSVESVLTMFLVKKQRNNTKDGS